MKIKILGTLLVAGALLAAAIMQASGRGLVTTRPATASPRVTPGPQGTTMVVTEVGPHVLFHLKRIVPVAGIAVLGLVCFFLPSRDETNA
jgi:hypothetical protein